MKITENNNELIWNDKPLFLQLFGLTFAALGLLFSAIGVIQFLKSDKFGLKTVTILRFMGIGFMFPSILTFWSFKNTEIKVNRLMQQVLYKHGKVMRKFAVSEIDKIEYVEGYDSDSGTVFTPMMRTL